MFYINNYGVFIHLQNMFHLLFLQYMSLKTKACLISYGNDWTLKALGLYTETVKVSHHLLMLRPDETICLIMALPPRLGASGMKTSV